MASSLSTEKLFSELLIQPWDHDPDSTNATIVTPDAGTTKRVVDMRDYLHFGVVAMTSRLTGSGITKLEIIACDSSDGTGNVTVVKDSGTVAADAVGDYVALECSAEEIKQLSEAAGATLRYVAARLTMQNAADEAVVTYVRGCSRWERSGLTATTIS